MSLMLSKKPALLVAPRLSLAVALLVLGAVTQSALALWEETAKVAGSDVRSGDYFGYSVAVWGDVAVIGAWEDDDCGDDSGSAYVYRFDGSTWGEEQKLLSSDGAAGDRFGTSVAVFADVVVVGAPYDDDQGGNSGSAYVFRFDGSAWVENQKLHASDGAANDYFGRSVAIEGDVILVGAYGDGDNGAYSGSAYVYQHDGCEWVQQQKLLASDGAGSDFFGTCVSVSDDVAVVGAYKDDDNGSSSGSAYVFRFGGGSWIEEQKLVASDGAESDFFGYSLSVSGDTIVVGAYLDDDHGASSGSAYAFHFDGSGWAEEAKLLAPDGAEGDEFGRAVAIFGDVAVVGAHMDDDMGDNSGSAYVFHFNGPTWTAEAKLLASDGYRLDCFGNAVAVFDNLIVVGAHQEDVDGFNTGAAYVFSGEAGFDDCNGNGVPDDLDIANGTSDDCNVNSVPDECDIADGTSQDRNGNGIPDECDSEPVQPDDARSARPIPW